MGFLLKRMQKNHGVISIYIYIYPNEVIIGCHWNLPGNNRLVTSCEVSQDPQYKDLRASSRICVSDISTCFHRSSILVSVSQMQLNMFQHYPKLIHRCSIWIGIQWGHTVMSISSGCNGYFQPFLGKTWNQHLFKKQNKTWKQTNWTHHNTSICLDDFPMISTFSPEFFEDFAPNHRGVEKRCGHHAVLLQSVHTSCSDEVLELGYPLVISTVCYWTWPFS